MEVRSIKLKSKTNSNVFIVTTSEGEYILHSDMIVRYGIHTGEVDSGILNKAADESEVLIGTALAMKYLGSRLKTVKGLKDYLYKKGYTTSCINTIIDKLTTYSILDDRTYAEAYIKANPKFSKMKLREKLRASGVSREIIDELLLDVSEEDSCMTNARKFLRGKILDEETRIKLTRRLLNMGYNFDTINTTINNLREDQ